MDAELQKTRRTRGPLPGESAGNDDGGMTLATMVHRQLREDILAGHLAPDTRLRVQAVAERYNAGTSPVREALNRLLSEGLVEQRDQRGFLVAPVSVEDLRELLLRVQVHPQRHVEAALRCRRRVTDGIDQEQRHSSGVIV